MPRAAVVVICRVEFKWTGSTAFGIVSEFRILGGEMRGEELEPGDGLRVISHTTASKKLDLIRPRLHEHVCGFEARGTTRTK